MILTRYQQRQGMFANVAAHQFVDAEGAAATATASVRMRIPGHWLTVRCSALASCM
jgi:hypothetical protein